MSPARGLRPCDPIDTSVDHYAALGVDPDADQATIERAYRERIKAVHPDRNDAPDADEQFRRVKEAHEVLSDQEARARYDRRRERRVAANNPTRGERPEHSHDRTQSADRTNVDPNRWAGVNLDEWMRAQREDKQERERRARQRRRRRNRVRTGSEREVGAAPSWYAANNSASRPEPTSRPRIDTVLLGLAAAYALIVAVAADPLSLPARLVVGLVTLMAVLFVLRVPEVAIPIVGIVVTIVLPTVALLGLPALSLGAVVGGLAVAVPTAAVALVVRLR